MIGVFSTAVSFLVKISLKKKKFCLKLLKLLIPLVCIFRYTTAYTLNSSLQGNIPGLTNMKKLIKQIACKIWLHTFLAFCVVDCGFQKIK